MATIKRNGGKVITKDGKVSCECCAAPGCCMYPAQGLIDGLYTENDLPDAVTVTASYFNAGQYFIGNFVYNKSGATYLPSQFPPPGSFPTFFGDLIATSFIDGESGPDPRYVWYLSDSFPQYGTACLIGVGYGAPVLQVNDQFADSYYIQGVGAAIRESPCVWRYVPPSPGGSIWIIEYGHPSPYKFSVRSTVIGSYPKNGDQNTPVGTYGPGLVIS